MYLIILLFIFKVFYYVFCYDSFASDIKERYSSLYNFVKESTKSIDESHDFKHAIAVCANTLHIARKIFSSETYKRYEPILVYSAMLHDVCDHKYKEESISRATLDDFVYSELGQKKGMVVLDIIDNISFSKEIKDNLKHLGKYQILRDIVSDADKIEALGSIGIQRCLAYSRKIQPEAEEEDIYLNALQHCSEKLLHLWSDYLRTNEGKKMSYFLHIQIVDWVCYNIYRVSDPKLKEDLITLIY